MTRRSCVKHDYVVGLIILSYGPGSLVDHSRLDYGLRC